MIDRFRRPACSFVMPPFGSPLHDDTFVDISHESLIRKWRRLKTWVDQEASSRAMYARLADAARRHQAGEAGLWRNPDLRLARSWFKREQPNATWAERYGGGFELADKFLRRSTRKALIVRGTLAALLIVSYGATFVAMQEAERQRKFTFELLRKLGELTYAMRDRLAKIPGGMDAVEDIYLDNIRLFQELSAAFGETQASAREQASNYMLLGDLWFTRGDLARARESYANALPKYQLLLQNDPGNPNWQRDLSIYYERIGKLQMADGDRAGALTAYRTGLAIAERMAKTLPKNVDWQRALSVFHEKIGDVLLEQGDAEGALSEYRIDLGIATELAGANRQDAELQNDLAISHERVARALAAAGKSDEAAEHTRAAQTIRESVPSR